MIDDAERLDAALNRTRIGAGLEDVAPTMRDLVEIALDVADSFGSLHLSAADHDRLYAESLLLVEARLRHQRHLWNRVPIGRRGAVLGGAAAATVVTVAAIGIAVVHERHKHRHAIPAAA